MNGNKLRYGVMDGDLVLLSLLHFFIRKTQPNYFNINVLLQYLLQELSSDQYFEIYLEVPCQLPMKISPYPLYNIDIPVITDVGTAIPGLKLGVPERLNSDIYLSCVNSVVDDEHPKQKAIFLLPMEFLDTNKFLGGRDLFVERLFYVFNSYPALKYVIAPYKEFILKIFIRERYFQCFWFSSKNVPPKFLSLVDEWICLSFRYYRYHFHSQYTDGLQPTTQRKNLYNEDDRYYSDWIVGIRTKKYHLINLQKKVKKNWSVAKVVLLLVPVLCCAGEVDPGEYFFTLKKKEQDKALKDLDSAMFSFTLSSASRLFAHRVVQNTIEGTYDDDISNVIKLGDSCMDNSGTCNGVPVQIANFFTTNLHSQLLEQELLVDYEFISIALRAIYHYHPDKEACSFAPLYMNNVEINKKFQQFTKKYKGNGVVRLNLHEKFFMKEEFTLISLLQMYSLNHTVCATMLFRKKNGKFTTECTVYDSAYNPQANEKSDASCINYIKDSRYTAEDLIWDNDHEDEVPWLNDLTKNFMKFSICRKLLAPMKGGARAANVDAVRSCLPAKRIDTHKNVDIRPSVLVQYKEKDNTCGINSFLCALLLMVGKKPEDGIPGILKEFKSINDYRHSMISLMYLIVAKYLEDSESVIQNLEANSSTQLHGDFEYKKVKQSCLDRVSKTNYQAALGEDILRLFEFLPSETFGSDRSKDGMC